MVTGSCALVRPGSGDRELAGLDVERHSGDVTDGEAVRQAVAGARVVVHAAAVVHVGWTRLAEMRRVNVEGTRLVAEAARREGARFVQVSSVNALGLTGDGSPADEDTPPGNTVECPYVVTKREAERAVLDEVGRGLDGVILNPVFMLGAWDWKPSSGRMLMEVAQGKGLLAPPGSQHFGDVRDIADAIVAAIDRGAAGRRYILGGHHLSFLEAWTVFAGVTGRRPPRGVAPPRLVRFAGRMGDLIGRCVGREGPLNSAAADMSLLCQHFSSDRTGRSWAIRSGRSRTPSSTPGAGSSTTVSPRAASARRPEPKRRASGAGLGPPGQWSHPPHASRGRS